MYTHGALSALPFSRPCAREACSSSSRCHPATPSFTPRPLNARPFTAGRRKHRWAGAGWVRSVCDDCLHHSANNLPESDDEDDALSIAEARFPREDDATFEERYSRDTKIGQGSWASVFEGQDAASGESVAIKVLPRHRPGLDPDHLRESFEKEVRMMCAVQGCEHIVQLKDFATDDKEFKIVEELCTGGDLHNLLHNQGRVSEATAAKIFRGMILSLERTHKAKICFSDTKPANFLLKTPITGPDGTIDESLPVVVKLADYGCSQWLNEEGAHLTKKAGTPVYLAPEAFMGAYGAEVDIWAAGVVLYQLLVGEHPFLDLYKLERTKLDIRAAAQGIMKAVLTRHVNHNHEAWKGLSEDARHLLRHVLDKDPRTRMTASDILQHPWLEAHALPPACHEVRSHQLNDGSDGEASDIDELDELDELDEALLTPA